MQDDSLSVSSHGRWATMALLQPDAATASSRVAVTSPAPFVVQSRQAMM